MYPSIRAMATCKRALASHHKSRVCETTGDHWGTNAARRFLDCSALDGVIDADLNAVSRWTACAAGLQIITAARTRVGVVLAHLRLELIDHHEDVLTGGIAGAVRW